MIPPLPPTRRRHTQAKAPFPSPLRGGRTRPQAEPGGGRGRRVCSETGKARWYRHLTPGGGGSAPTQRPPPRPFAALRLGPPRKGEGRYGSEARGGLDPCWGVDERVRGAAPTRKSKLPASACR